MSTIYHQFIIKADIEKIFEAITDPGELANWWPDHCTGECALDGKYNFYFTEEYDWFAKIVEIDNLKKVEYKMTTSDLDWEPTSFGFELSNSENGVVVNFYHKDWRSENDHFKIASFCWAMLLNGLKNYVEKGIVVPFKNRS